MPESAEINSAVKPEFDGGNFTIDYLSRSPSGFEIKTRQTNLRHAPNTPLPEAERIKTERDKEPLKYRIGLGFAPKVGVRNLLQEGNALSMDIMPVTFPTYKAISDGTESEETLGISNPSATSSILLTTEDDGSHKIILQHRSANNYFYGDVPGASIAGYMDGKLDPDNRGKLIPVDTASLKRNILKELEEELGLSDTDVEQIKITGISQERVKYHTEFLSFGISKLNTEGIAKKVEERAKGKRPEDHFDFEGAYFVIDGTPEAIEKLLSEVKCPLPATHVATFVAGGYSMIVEKNGIEAADEWKKKLEKSIRENYRQIDETVVKFYETHSEEINNQKEGKPARKTDAYDPAYLPTEQGLPDIKSELSRVGLI